MRTILLLTLLGCSINVFSQSHSDEQQIREVRSLSNQSIASHDSIAIARFWAADFHMVSSRNSEVSGREQNQKLFAREFRTRKDVIYVRTPSKIDVFTDWNMASETGTWAGQWQEADGVVKLSGTYYAKWHKINGEWKIRAEIFTPLSCTGSSFCNQNPKLD